MFLEEKYYDVFLDSDYCNNGKTYIKIKGTVTMALFGTSTVCTYVYDNSKCIGATRDAVTTLAHIGPTSCQYHINNCDI